MPKAYLSKNTSFSTIARCSLKVTLYKNNKLRKLKCFLHFSIFSRQFRGFSQSKFDKYSMSPIRLQLYMRPHPIVYLLIKILPKYMTLFTKDLM